jgi:Arc/MetJ-type ribon-helix-helix transcriptional regulator
MTVTVEIPKEIEAQIIAQAQASGVPPSEVVRDLLISAWEHKAGSHEVAKERALAAAIRIRELRKGVTLDGLSIKDLINEGRP